MRFPYALVQHDNTAIESIKPVVWWSALISFGMQQVHILPDELSCFQHPFMVRLRSKR